MKVSVVYLIVEEMNGVFIQL